MASIAPKKCRKPIVSVTTNTASDIEISVSTFENCGIAPFPCASLLAGTGSLRFNAWWMRCTKLWEDFDVMRILFSESFDMTWFLEKTSDPPKNSINNAMQPRHAASQQHATAERSLILIVLIILNPQADISRQTSLSKYCFDCVCLCVYTPNLF